MITEWYNTNENRRYPFADFSVLRDKFGTPFDPCLIADVSLTVPAALGEVYCSSLRISPYAVSISFASAAGTFLVGTYTRTAVAGYASMPLTTLVAGAAGNVVFKAELPDSVLVLCDSLAQSQLAERAIVTVPDARVTAFGTSRCAELATGDVTIISNGALLITANGRTLTLELQPGQARSFLNPYDTYADANGCVVPPIRRINNVYPDADGIITIHFTA